MFEGLELGEGRKTPSLTVGPVMGRGEGSLNHRGTETRRWGLGWGRALRALCGWLGWVVARSWDGARWVFEGLELGEGR